MHTTTHEDRTLTELDHVRITRLLQRDPRAPRSPAAPAGGPLLDMLDAAELVPSREVPPDVVTMYSRITVEDTSGGQRRVLTLCYPEDAEPSEGFISVLSPIGAALLGKRVSETARPASPDVSAPSLRIVEILFQPEASGDYTL
ncbi:MAG TPA: GreA/GreB family elongation factor [Quisquiliibacterium sp.]|nr:GreA/GreB family elongation factor [Quisquiliibacterium sp.]